jgi:hypothetical protein
MDWDFVRQGNYDHFVVYYYYENGKLFETKLCIRTVKNKQTT